MGYDLNFVGQEHQEDYDRERNADFQDAPLTILAREEQPCENLDDCLNEPLHDQALVPYGYVPWSPASVTQEPPTRQLLYSPPPGGTAVDGWAVWLVN